MFKISIVMTAAIIIAGIIFTFYPNNTTTEPWDSSQWVRVLSFNHDNISRCYGYLLNDQLLQFQQTCNIDKMLYTENLLIESYAKAKQINPNLTNSEFLLSHYHHKTATTIAAHQSIQTEFNMTLMIMAIADPLVDQQINNTKQETNHETNIQTIPSRAHD